MSWEVQFRKSEAELDLKLSSFQNLSPENDSVQLEAEIETLLNKLNSIVKVQDSSPNVSRKFKISETFSANISWNNRQGCLLTKRDKEKYGVIVFETHLWF